MPRDRFTPESREDYEARNSTRFRVFDTSVREERELLESFDEKTEDKPKEETK